MGEIYLNGHKIVDELVGVVGMLNNRGGSTLKDIICVLESLHGPMRQDFIQDGLKAGISSGVIECKNRRYKVRKQEVVFGRNTAAPVAGCSSWEFGIPRDTDSIEDVVSISSTSTQFEQDLLDEISCSPSESCSLKEILSVKSIQSSDGSVCTYPYSRRSQGSFYGADLKGRRRKGKKRLVVKWPTCNKNLTVENDSENNPIIIDDSDHEIKNNLEASKSGQVLAEDKQTQECVQNDLEYDLSLKKCSGSPLPAKRSMNDVMAQVMKQFSVQKIGAENLKFGRVEQEQAISASLNVSPIRTNDSPSYSDEFTSKSTTRNVGTDPQDALPSSSKNKSSKPTKGEKKLKQEYDNNDTPNKHRYLTRSRAKAGELKRSRLQSSSESNTSLKRGKFPED